MKEWMTKFQYDPFMEHFFDEQDYVDACFIMIVLAEFGVWLEDATLLRR